MRTCSLSCFESQHTDKDVDLFSQMSKLYQDDKDEEGSPQKSGKNAGSEVKRPS